MGGTAAGVENKPDKVSAFLELTDGGRMTIIK